MWSWPSDGGKGLLPKASWGSQRNSLLAGRMGLGMVETSLFLFLVLGTSEFGGAPMDGRMFGPPQMTVGAFSLLAAGG